MTDCPRTAAERLRAVQDRMAAAARAAGREVEDIELLAVSKLQPAAAVEELHALGQLDFGENYLQEALAKREALAHLPIRWHFTGRVQSNKAKLAIGPFALLHGVDTVKLVHILQKHAGAYAQVHEKPFVQELLLQVNIGDEEQKAGVAPDQLEPLALEVMERPNLRLTGLMCLPPFLDDPEAARPFFARLRVLRDELEPRLGMKLPRLSMGMSMDFEEAIAEGATIIRVGTDLFGPRPRAVT